MGRVTTLRVIVDQIVAPVPGGIGRYAEELTRALIATAPPGFQVEGFVSASPDPDYERIAQLLPGLARLHKSALARRELSAAWQHGFSRLPGQGMVHATSLLAPLSKHDRVQNPGDQIAVTIHDVVPWTHPETLTPRGVTWHKAMAKRAQKHADAVVVPTHAVAEQLAEVLDLGDRVRVIGGAASTRLAVPADPDAVAERLALPERYLLAVGTLEPRKGLDRLIAALALVEHGDVPLLIAGPAGWGDVRVDQLAQEAGLAEGRVRALGSVSDGELALLYSRAAAFVFPSLAEGFGLPVLEAFALGAPVIHSDAPALLEVSADSGLIVPLADAAGYPARLASAIDEVLGDATRSEQLRVLGRDRASVFSWNASAEKVWQLHADL